MQASAAEYPCLSSDLATACPDLVAFVVPAENHSTVAGLLRRFDNQE
jgi:hypothetical protein